MDIVIIISIMLINSDPKMKTTFPVKSVKVNFTNEV